MLWLPQFQSMINREPLTNKEKKWFKIIFVLFVGGIIAAAILLSIMAPTPSIYKKVVNKYEDLVYLRKDTTFTGVVKSINNETVKRFGDPFSRINGVFILSDTIEFLVLLDKLTFDIEDTVIVNVENTNRPNGASINSTITTVTSIKNNQSTKTLFVVKNCYYLNLMNEELNNHNHFPHTNK